jgi:hypothetical protein
LTSGVELRGVRTRAVAATPAMGFDGVLDATYPKPSRLGDL